MNPTAAEAMTIGNNKSRYRVARGCRSERQDSARTSAIPSAPDVTAPRDARKTTVPLNPTMMMAKALRGMTG